MKITREIKTAILVLGGVALFIYGYSFLKGNAIFNNTKTLYAIYDEVEGLVSGAKVSINGLSVGKISKIDFLTNTTKIMVTMEVRQELNFSNKSTAMLYETGLIGGKAIAIVPVFDPQKVVKDGDTLQATVKPGLTELINRQIEPLQVKIESMLSSADSLFAGVSNVLNYESQNNLKLALKGLTESISNINELSESMGRIVNANEKVFNSTMGHVETTSKNLSQLTDSLSKIELSTTMKNMEVASTQLKSILVNLEKGKGSAGKLLNDDALYNELLHSSEALEALLTDLKEHPKKYVHFSLFGRKEKSTSKK